MKINDTQIDSYFDVFAQIDLGIAGRLLTYARLGVIYS